MISDSYFAVAIGLLVPLFGTALGAACVLLMRKRSSVGREIVFLGLAAGVMLSASLFSLLLPALDAASDLGTLSFLPAAVGFALGMAFPLLPEKLGILGAGKPGKRRSTSMLVLAVVLHNVPEGMAVGVLFSAAIVGGDATLAAAMTFSLGIAIQNFPEGAIISMPLAARGMPRGRAFLRGVLSGVVEPVAGALTVLLSWLAAPLLPYLLAFAAGAMIAVVLSELAPEFSGEGGSRGMLAFSVGFLLMMILDVVFS